MLNNHQKVGRLRLGIIFNFSSSWMGGVIYIINVVNSLRFLDDNKQPEIFLFFKPELKKFLGDFNYPYINFIEWKFPPVFLGFLKSWIYGRNVFVEGLIDKYSLQAVFPGKNYPLKSKNDAKIIAWYADLQHKYYPEFFSKMTILNRNLRLYFMLRNSTDLVVSSQAAKDDFMSFFRIRKELRIHIFHFTSVNNNLEYIHIDELRLKYNLPENYFLVSNQFHKHKNHKILLLAIILLKQKGILKNLAFTGKFPSAENSPYLAELHNIINENDLYSQIFFLGVLPRNDQLNIMKYSQAVLQPSLFEGWSTVIEDAKSLQVPVIASNLKVNMEQLGNKGVYFDPLNAKELASILANYPQRDFNKLIYNDYNKSIRESAKLFLGILSGHN